MNIGQSVRTVADIHTRPVHCIAQNKVTIALPPRSFLVEEEGLHPSTRLGGHQLGRSHWALVQAVVQYD